MSQTQATALCPSTFIGDVAPTNVAPYIRRCYITDENILNLSVPMNKLSYIHRCYIRQCIYRLTDEFMLYSSV
jgi:hypothetical protein